VDLLERHRALLAAGVRLAAPIVEERDEPDDDTRALITAITELRVFGEFNPNLHPRGEGGRFRTVLDRVKFALTDWAHNGGERPLTSGPNKFSREQLRNAAKGLGVPLPRGASDEEIEKKLLDHTRELMKRANIEPGRGDHHHPGEHVPEAPHAAEAVKEPAKVTKKAAAPVKKAAPKKATTPAFESDPKIEARAEREGVSRAAIDDVRRQMAEKSPVPFKPLVRKQDHYVAPWAIDPKRYAGLEKFFNAHPGLYNQLAHEQQVNTNWGMEYRKKYPGKTLEQAKAEATAALKEATTGPIVVRRKNESSLRRILEDGRMKTQFETGTSSGLLDTEGRKKLEDAALGIPTDTPDAKRPVYGVVSPGGVKAVDGKRAVDEYGDIQLVLKPSVRDRTTVTVGDSLVSPTENAVTAVAAPIDHPDWRAALPNGVKNLGDSRFESKNYVEAQIHNGVTVDDIQEVVFARQPETGTVAALKAAGLSWRVLEPRKSSRSDHVDGEARHRMLRLAGIDLAALVEAEPDVEARALIAAILEFADDELGEERSEWNPLSHPRGEHGRFRSILDRVKNALAGWAHGEGGDHPLTEGPNRFSREHLRQAAKGLGVSVPRGADDKTIEKALLDHTSELVAKAKGEHAPSGHDVEQAARDRMNAAQSAGKVAATLSELHAMVHDEASDKALLNRLEARRKQGVPDSVIDPLVAAVKSGDRSNVTSAIHDLERQHNLRQVTGGPGSVETFDQAKHDRPYDAKPGEFTKASAAGALVGVERPGYEATNLPTIPVSRETEVENRVRQAYRDAVAAGGRGMNGRPVTQKLGEGEPPWVRLSAVRQHLGSDVSREEADAALQRLGRAGDVHLYGDENQKTVNAADREAAFNRPFSGDRVDTIRFDRAEHTNPVVEHGPSAPVHKATVYALTPEEAAAHKAAQAPAKATSTAAKAAPDHAELIAAAPVEAETARVLRVLNNWGGLSTTVAPKASKSGLRFRDKVKDLQSQGFVREQRGQYVLSAKGRKALDDTEAHAQRLDARVGTPVERVEAHDILRGDVHSSAERVMVRANAHPQMADSAGGYGEDTDTGDLIAGVVAHDQGFDGPTQLATPTEFRRMLANGTSVWSCTEASSRAPVE
jgi:hypothetical protein